VYVLRRAFAAAGTVPAALSVTALERARGLSPGAARRELARYAHAQMRSWYGARYRARRE